MTVTATPETATTLVSTFSIAPGHLIAALSNGVTFASRDYGRPALCHLRVVIGRETVMTESTDSYALIRHTAPIVEWVGGEACSILVDQADATAIVRWAKAQKGAYQLLVTVDTIGTSLRVSLGVAGAGVAVRIAGPDTLTYPNIDALYASQVAGQVGEFALGAVLLAKLAKLIDPEAGKVTTGLPVKFVHSDTNLKPIHFSAGSCIDGLVMTVRIK